MIYVAGPYSHPDEGVRAKRTKMLGAYSAHLMRQSLIVFSPINMCHEIALHNGLPKDADFWWFLNRHYMDHCTELHVVKLDGWETSKGVIMEIDYAVELRMKLEFVDWNDEWLGS